MARDERRVGPIDDDELVRHALGVGEAEAVAGALRGDALAPEPLGPEVERLGRGDAREDAVHHAGPGPPRDRARVLEEREVGAGAAQLVGVEQVVDARIVLVDRLLDEPHAKDASVEIDVPGRIARDRRDVVDALELHEDPLLQPQSGRPPRAADRLSDRRIAGLETHAQRHTARMNRHIAEVPNPEPPPHPQPTDPPPTAVTQT